jgi:hypothetical protein
MPVLFFAPQMVDSAHPIFPIFVAQNHMFVGNLLQTMHTIDIFARRLPTIPSGQRRALVRVRAADAKRNQGVCQKYPSALSDKNTESAMVWWRAAAQCR